MGFLQGILQDGEGGREALLDYIDRLLFREELRPDDDDDSAS
jgi:hypothetical protein